MTAEDIAEAEELIMAHCNLPKGGFQVDNIWGDGDDTGIEFHGWDERVSPACPYSASLVFRGKTQKWEVVNLNWEVIQAEWIQHHPGLSWP